MLQKVLLNINSPGHQVPFTAVGTDQVINVAFAGTTVSTDHGGTPLFHKWYSSLAAEIGAGEAISEELRVGSHVITFSAADQDDTSVPKEDLEELYASVAHMGYAGGAPLPESDPDNPGPVVIHVFIANMLAPDGDAANLSESAPDLRAEVPLQWAEYPDFLDPDPTYHANNKLQYRWTLSNLTDGTQPEVVVAEEQLTFNETDEDNEYAWLGYNQPLTALVVGDTYRVALRVQDATNPLVGHTVSRDLVIIS
jgi:hypothetical protein